MVCPQTQQECPHSCQLTPDTGLVYCKAWLDSVRGQAAIRLQKAAEELGKLEDS